MRALHPPPAVLEIAEQLEEAGFEAWCVGGAIRDALLGHPHLDWDLATSATPTEVRDLFGRRRTIPVGIDFGTVGVLDRDGVLHEVTTFRRDVQTDGRHAVVEFGASLEEDLARRDFTINAIAYSPKHREIRDPFDGRADLARRIVRAVGEPEARMREDRLRALRAIRFSARFGFTIEPTTLRAIVESAPHLGRLSPERVKQELEKTLEQAQHPASAVALWKSTGALATLIPSLAGVDDVVIAALDCLAAPGPRARPQRRIARVAVLFVGLAAEAVQLALEDLRFSRQEIKWIVNLAARWAALGGTIADALTADAPVSDVAVRRWVAAIGRLEIGAFMRVANARWSAARAEGAVAPVPQRVRSLYRRMLWCAFRSGDPLELRDLAVDGDDLRREGIPPGPLTGKILQALLAMVLDDPALNVPDVLLREAKRLYEDLRDDEGAGNGRE